MHRLVVRAALDEAGRVAVVLVADLGRRDMDRRHDALGGRVDLAHGLRGKASLGPLRRSHDLVSDFVRAGGSAQRR